LTVITWLVSFIVRYNVCLIWDFQRSCLCRSLYSSMQCPYWIFTDYIIKLNFSSLYTSKCSSFGHLKKFLFLVKWSFDGEQGCQTQFWNRTRKVWLNFAQWFQRKIFKWYFGGSKSASICIFLYKNKNENEKCFVETNNMQYTTRQEGATIQIWAHLADDEGKFGWNLPNGFRGYFLTRGSALSWACVAHLSFCSEET
jgi:hypothetical protein